MITKEFTDAYAKIQASRYMLELLSIVGIYFNKLPFPEQNELLDAAKIKVTEFYGIEPIYQRGD